MWWAACFLMVSSLVMGGDDPARSIEIKPVAITLDASPEVDTPRSCVLRCRAGAMNILSVAASDPAIAVGLREHLPGEIYVITATLPARYRTQNPHAVSILVKTDLAPDPVIRIPVRVWPPPAIRPTGWLDKLKSFVGGVLPNISLDRQEGEGKLRIPVSDGKVKVLVFSAHWCGHCDHHLPIINQVWEDYAGKGVQFFGIAAGAGNGQGIAEAAKRWELGWPLGVDRDMSWSHHFGIRAFPVVLLVNPYGIIEAVHGRFANRDVNNGLDDIELQLRAELEVLLGGGTRADFPDWEKELRPPPQTQPASTREDRPVLKVEHEVKGAPSRPGETRLFKVAIQNEGLKPLKLGKITLPEDVTIKSELDSEVPPGGVVVACCQVVSPKQSGSYSRRIAITSNDPKKMQTEVFLIGNVVEPH